jgi:hypothetical protein
VAGRTSPRTRPSDPGHRPATGPGLCGRALSFVVVASLAVACAPAPPRFAGSLESQPALVEEFLRALEAKDKLRLQSLALSEEEFKTEAYPEMPAYGKIPADFAWQQLYEKSRAGLETVLARQGGHGYDLEDVTFKGAHTAYATFVVHRRPMVKVRDRKTGEEKTLALFGSILEHRGRFKLFSFNIDR